MLITNEHRHIIKKHMAINNLTQAEFAGKTGVNQKTVSDWLSGPFKKVRNSTAYVLLELIPEMKALEKKAGRRKGKGGKVVRQGRRSLQRLQRGG